MKKIVLTFDDGPSEKFSELLDYLEKNGHKAIFFCNGENLEKKNLEKDLLRAIKKGFVIGNHSCSHPNFNKISYSRGKKEIEKTDKIIERLYKKAGVKREFRAFRFPFFCKGFYNFFKYESLLKSLGYRNPYFDRRFFDIPVAVSRMYHFFRSIVVGKSSIYCDLDPNDWDAKNPFSEIEDILSKAKDRDIIVLHDHGSNNMETDKKICKYLSSRGFNLSY